jgi:hypothetical protein
VILPTQEPEPVPEIIEPTTEAIPELVSEKIPREPTQISWPQYSRKVSQSIPYVQASYKQKVKPDPILAKPGASGAREIEMEFLEDSEIPISVIPDEPKLPSPILTGEPAIPELPPIPPSPLGDIKQRVASVGILGLGFAEKAAFFLRRDSPPLHRLIERVSELAKVPVLTSEVPPDATQIGTRLLRAPSVLKAIQLSAQQVFQQTLRVRQSLVETAEGAPRVLSELESTQVVERILDDTDAVAEVVERERESRAAMVTAQVDKVTRELSERVSETYQRGMSSLLPGFMGSAAGHLALAPSMGKMSTMEMTQMSERMASLYSSQEIFEEQAKYVSGSAPFQQFLTISQQVTNMAGAARGLEFLGDTIGELTSSIPYYGQPPSRQMMQVSHQMEELAAAAQANKVASMFTELVETQIRTEQLFGEPIEGAVSSIMETPVGADALDRIILDTPVGYPSLKLHEVLPVVQRIAQAPTRIPEQTPRPRPTFVTEKPAEFREAQRFDDIDMKELEKKIARILKEEARRYGVY